MKGIVLSELLNEAKTEEAPKLKPIEFVKSAKSKSIGFDFGEVNFKPSHYESVVLLLRNYGNGGLDAMWAVSRTESNSCFYLGHWNDGVTE